MSETPSKPKGLIVTGIIILAAIVALGIYAVVGQDHDHQHDHLEATSNSQPETTSTTQSTDQSSQTPADVTINVEAGNYYFSPQTINVKKGQKVRIVLTAKGMTHDFVIDELGVSVPLTDPGQTNSVVFTADQVGSFTYYCSVANHRRLGQVGTLTVSE